MGPRQQQPTVVNLTQGTPAVMISEQPAKLPAKQHSSSKTRIGEVLLLLLHLQH
jgi:hypothetical protein